MAGQLNWGIIGCGNIARKFAAGLKASRTGRLVAAGSRSKDKAAAFAREFGAARGWGSYEELLADPDVAAVYVATPHTAHAEWTIKAAEAGRHVLCEKPLALNHGEAMQAVEAARRCGVFLMEAFMYRCHPQIARVAELVRSGAVGEVRMIQAAFGFQARFSPEGRLFRDELGGGGILDVGCYPVSLARLVAGAAVGKDFADPEQVVAAGQLAKTGTDAWAAAVLKFAGGILAQVATAVEVQLVNDARIIGSEGWIHVPQPWQPGRFGAPRIVVQRSGAKEPEEISFQCADLYGMEADVVAENLDRREAPPPAMGWEDSLGNMRALDAWRAAIGQQYGCEKPASALRTVTGRPLERAAWANMKYGKVPGVDRPVSRLVMGVDNQRAMPHAAAMFDDYFERGGNCFDCAWLYSGGACERILGQWVKNRGLREQVVILDKGAHTPECNPAAIGRQLAESLERLQTDHVDIYMMHRDNPEVPVGEFADALNAELRAGRCRAFGGSNWSLERVQAFSAHAREHGLVPMAAVSNQLSLARPLDVPWKGCLSAWDRDYRQWLAGTGTALMPWSSQARGFFAGRARPEDRSDPELVRCWYSEDNFKRLERARELAARRGVAPIVVALAWVLNQPFPTFPLIGPRQIGETRVSFQALELELSAEEVAWLNLED